MEAKESYDIQKLENQNSKTNLFPDDEIPGMKPSVRALAHQSVILARRLLRSLAEDLGADPMKFLGDHSEMFGEENATSLRLLHYPPVMAGNLAHRKAI